MEDNAEVIDILNRANLFRQQCDFEQALSVLEGALGRNLKESEIYWTAVLCRYDVEYVMDSSSRR